MAESSNFLVDDGILVWFNGPEWDEVALEAFNEATTRVEQAAKLNAPWKDRTGRARAGLTARSQADNGDIVLTLFHTVEYGLWLEVIQNGNFATIMPTLEQYAPVIMREATQRVARARRGRD